MIEQETQANKAAATTAHILSDVFSPLLTPTYAMAATLWLTNLRYLPSGVLWWALVGVFLITCFLPASFIFWLMRKGKVSDTSISNPRQRFIPYSFAIVCYVGAAIFVVVLHAPGWMPRFFLGAAVVTALSMLITKWWKISAHAASAGGVAALIYWLVFNGYLNTAPMLWLTASFLIVGFVAWARLYLNHHTPTQVLAGAVMAFIIEYSAVTFF